MAEYIPLPEHPELLSEVPRENFIEYALNVQGHWRIANNSMEVMNFLANALVNPGSLSYQDHAVLEKLRAELNGKNG